MTQRTLQKSLLNILIVGNFKMSILRINSGKIRGWNSLTRLFQSEMNMPEYVIGNINATADYIIDYACGDNLVIDLGDCRSLKRRHLDIVTYLQNLGDNLTPCIVDGSLTILMSH